MEGLSPRHYSDLVARIHWFAKEWATRLYRRYGLGGTLILLFAAAVIVLSFGLVRSEQRVELAKQALNRALTSGGIERKPLSDAGPLAELRAFEAYLSAYEDIPDVMQAMFRLAEKEGLTLQRGEYKRDLDIHGNFVRYRMNLPLKGDAQAIYRFTLAALQAHRSLALESIQFKRSRTDMKDIEGSIQWVLLARPPVAPRNPEKAPLLSLVNES